MVVGNFSFLTESGIVSGQSC